MSSYRVTEIATIWTSDLQSIHTVWKYAELTGSNLAHFPSPSVGILPVHHMDWTFWNEWEYDNISTLHTEPTHLQPFQLWKKLTYSFEIGEGNEKKEGKRERGKKPLWRQWDLARLTIMCFPVKEELLFLICALRQGSHN